ncbi:MAG: hypothetical protein R6U96_04635 [Promethearchaeia archaeon]
MRFHWEYNKKRAISLGWGRVVAVGDRDNNSLNESLKCFINEEIDILDLILELNNQSDPDILKINKRKFYRPLIKYFLKILGDQTEIFVPKKHSPLFMKNSRYIIAIAPRALKEEEERGSKWFLNNYKNITGCKCPSLVKIIRERHERGGFIR